MYAKWSPLIATSTFVFLHLVEQHMSCYKREHHFILGEIHWGKTILDLCLEHPQMSAQVFHFVNSCSQAENGTAYGISGQTHRHFIPWIKNYGQGKKSTRKFLTEKLKCGKTAAKDFLGFLN